MGGAMLSKSLIQFSVDDWGYIPSLLFDLRPNYGGGNEDNGEKYYGWTYFQDSRAWTCGHIGEGRERWDELGVWDWDIYTTMCKIDS